MRMQHPVRTILVSAVALGAFGVASVAMAQASSAPGQFERGTESTATYPLPGSNGGTLTVHAGMPAETQHYGPPPAFATLDADHDGRISEAEANAYPPLESDFLFASGGGKTISKAQYEKWAKTQFAH